MIKNEAKSILIGLCLIGICALGIYYISEENYESYESDVYVPQEDYESYDIEKFKYVVDSGLKFNDIKYAGNHFSIDYRHVGDKELKEQISFDIDVENMDDSVFKNELKIALKSIGVTDEECKELMDSIEFYLTNWA